MNLTPKIFAVRKNVVIILSIQKLVVLLHREIEEPLRRKLASRSV